MARPWARFDELRGGASLPCPPPSRILTAVRLVVVNSLRGWRQSGLVVGQRYVHGAPRVAVESSPVGGS
jgi:hypothetical protein